MKRNMNIKYYNDKAREQQNEKEQKIFERNFSIAQKVLEDTAKEILAKYSKK